MAVAQRRPAPGLIFHSDRGCQYTSGDFRKLLTRHRIVQSLSRLGQCSRQRRRRELLRNAERGAPLPRRLADPKRREARHLRVRRGLLQSPADALLAGLLHAGRLRSKTRRPGPRPGSVRNVSVEAGQPQWRYSLPYLPTAFEATRRPPLMWARTVLTERPRAAAASRKVRSAGALRVGLCSLLAGDGGLRMAALFALVTVKPARHRVGS